MPAGTLTADGPRAGQPASDSPRGRLPERLRDSLWIGWTLTILFNYVAFFWIGSRAKNRRWTLWGIVYAFPNLVGMLIADNEALWNSSVGDVVFGTALILGVVSIGHAFAIRRNYIAQRQAVLLGSPTVSPPQPAAPAPMAQRAGRNALIIGLYVAIGLVGGIGAFVAALASDPCLPFGAAPPGYARTDAVEAILTVGLFAYLALLIPITTTRRASRVWWWLLAGGPVVIALTLFACWLATALTNAPPVCNM